MGDYTNVYSFHDKTLAERLEEYTNILSAQGKIVPASSIRAEWVCDVEVVIEPVGWQALWKIPRGTCENYGIRYPTIVLVEVLGMDFPVLNALVKITAVQDDIHLPEKHEVSLIELYPTIDQTNPSLDIVGTAHCVDRLRFFYNYLWMPWDEDEDDNVDWVAQHLERRIRLFFDMNNGVIGKETCEIIRSLTSEAREIQKKISTYESLLPEDFQEDDLPEELAQETCTLMKLHFRLRQIKAEMDLLENPSLRGLLGKNQSYNRRKKRGDNENRRSAYYFVWPGGVVKEMQELSNKIQTMLPEDAPIKISGYLDDVMEVFETGDTVLLGEGNYSIKGSNGLQEGGSIIGISCADNTAISPLEPDMSSSLFDFSGNEILLRNICVDFGALQAGIIVRKDCTVLVTGCRIRVSNVSASSSAKWGAVVMPGAKLVLENTVFQGLGTAVIIYGTGEVVMNDCQFDGCCEGVRLNDNARFTATKSSFECIENGQAIVMETEKVTRSETVELGNEHSSVSLKNVSLNECKFFNDDKGSVTLRPKDTTALTQRHIDSTAEVRACKEEAMEL
ncbi:PREDICTED: SHC SH2 domain-binding protein 1 [Wasmannia auropunctata]|uniref:SHC SH2 domain-binding protein 1 n=1 Tax=Wasmannia auropunctata TaxID=64793 RepID=UPI0005EDCE46|nr:PREDICTED: SHC SH2 domain-binding protein 1 [Wasmannia auropunctata]